MQVIYDTIGRLESSIAESESLYSTAYRNYYDVITRAVCVTDDELAHSLREEAQCIDVLLGELQSTIDKEKKELALLKKCRVPFTHDNLPESIRTYIVNHRIRPYSGRLEQFAIYVGITIIVESEFGQKTYGHSGEVIHCVEYLNEYYLT